MSTIFWLESSPDFERGRVELALGELKYLERYFQTASQWAHDADPTSNQRRNDVETNFNVDPTPIKHRTNVVRPLGSDN